MHFIIKSNSSELASPIMAADAHDEMPEPTNLTDRISHLRDRRDRSPVVRGAGSPEAPKKNSSKRKRPERKFATDYFMVFVYALLAIALIVQLALVVWLDVI